LCGSFLPVLNPVVVIPGLRAINCTVLRGSLLIVSCVSKCVCHLLIKNYFTLLYFTWGIKSGDTSNFGYRTYLHIGMNLYLRTQQLSCPELVLE